VTSVADGGVAVTSGVSYQWYVGSAAVSGATASSYTPVESNEGQALSVQVTYAEPGGLPPEVTTLSAGTVVAQPTILLQNTNGSLAEWQMTGTTLTSGAVLGPNPGPTWLAAATGGFFAGDSSDIVLQDSQYGAVALWQVRDSNVLNTYVLADPGTSWHVKGTGDFYADGNTDVALQNDNGAIAMWDVNSAGMISQSGVVGINPGPTWHVDGTGNFYGNGNTDLVLQNDDGSVAIWDMNGTTVAQSELVADPGTTWHVKGTGDFYGDGHSDILLQNDNGSVALWEVTGSGIVQSSMVADPGSKWHVQATGNFSNDGHADIVLQNDDGTVAMWEMNNGAIQAGAAVANPSTAWSVDGNDSMRFIYSTSPGETLAATPSAPDEFVFTNVGSEPSGFHTVTGFNPVQDMIELSSTQFPNGFASVQANTTQNGTSTWINLGNGSTLVLQGVNENSLHASNFAVT
jgi:hypothetical protein